MMSENFEMVAKTLYGLEDVLADELRAIGAEDVENGKRMVSFTGDLRMLYKANFHCRTALRILKPVVHFKAYNADDVYDEVKKVEWDNYFSPSDTFTIDAVIFSESFNHSKFVAYKTKDAIADYFNEKLGKRPSVSIKNPDFYINIHISHNDCTVSLDSSGESLHRRGYRLHQGEAPISEVLAAGMILQTGWRGESNFVDPFCGSGTLLIEAAMIALNIPPGIYRPHYAFEKWKDFDGELFDEVCNDDSGETNFDFKCYGSDISPKAIEKAQENVKNTGLTKYIELNVKPFQQFSETVQPGILVTNPPYGERISTDDLIGLYGVIGERLKHVFMGYDAWILSYKDEYFEKIGLRPKHKIKLMNGELECEYRCYELFEGKNREYKMGRTDERVNGRREEGAKARRHESANVGAYLRGRPNFERFDSNSEEKELRLERSERHNRLAARHQGLEEKEEKAKRKLLRAQQFDGERKPFERSDRDRKPFERKSFGRSERDKKPYERSERDRKPFERKSFGRSERDKKPYERSERKPFERSERDRKPFERFDRDRKSFEKSDRKPYERSERKPFERSERDRKPFERFDRDRKSFEKSDRDRKPFERGKKPSDASFRRDDKRSKPLRKTGDFARKEEYGAKKRFDKKPFERDRNNPKKTVKRRKYED
jgi:putative N6-adenine-specific DNA methylase